MPLNAHLIAEPTSIALLPTPLLQTQLALHVNSPKSIQLSDYTLGPWQSHLSATIQSNDLHSQVELLPGKLVELQSLQGESVSFAETVVSLKNTQLLVQHNGNLQSVTAWPLSIQMENLISSDIHVELFTLRMRLKQWKWYSEEDFELNIESTIPALQSRWHNQLLPRLQVKSDLTVTPKLSHLQLTGQSLVDELQVAATGTITNSGNPKVKFNVDWPNWSQSAYLQQLVQQKDPEAMITNGALKLEADYQIIHAAPKLALEVELSHVSAVIDQILLQDLNAQAKISDLFDADHTNALFVSIEQFNPGIPIDEVQIRAIPFLNAQYQAGFNVQEGRVQLLGGNMWLSPFEWHQPQGEFELRSNLENLDLTTIIALEAQPDLSGSGRLDGILPIRINPQGIQIQNGKIWARSPGGVIRYRPNQLSDEIARTNPLMQITMQVLSHYQYDQLAADVNYSTNGDLTLDAHLAGRNPDFNQGQSVNLNLNVEDNIPTLLKSLRIAQDVSGMIDNRMNEN